ncbi:hypothetical protein EV424DRAFT_1347991 [Suillus variegatus]|nr:hypothetical protein EV424DRAFT_1347991 [Suillus variegatus]
MAPQRWASPEEEEFVYTFYEQYQQCQARRDYSTFWKPFYEAWGAKFPKWLVVFPEIPLDEELNGEQKQIVSKVYKERKLQLMHKLRNDWGSSKASRKAKNNREKTCASLIASITAPQRARALQSHKAYSKLYFATCVKPAVDAEMQRLQHVANLAKLSNGMDERGEKDINDTTADDPTSSSMEKGQLPKRIAVIKQVTRELHDRETPEVKAEVAAYIEQLNEKKRWSFSVLMGGPTPALGGKIDVSSFHVGRTEMGNLFSEAYPHFNSTIMKPWVEFVNRAHSTAAAKGLRKDGGIESMNDTKTVGIESIDPSHTVMNHHVTNTSEQNPTMSNSSNLDTTALLPPLDDIARIFPTSSFSFIFQYISINPYDNFSWIPLALQPSAETSEQGKTYTPGLFLPQPLPQLPQPLPQTCPSALPFMCAPSQTMALLQSLPGVPPSQITAQSPPATLAQSSPLPSTINSTGPSTVSIPVQSSPVVPPQVSTDARETSQMMALPQSLPGVPPSQIPAQNLPAAPAQSLAAAPVDSPDASLSIPPPHTSK